MRRLDSAALYEAVNARRIDQGMSWEQLSAEIGVSVATIKRARDGGRMEVDGMLAMVSWLGVTVETFVRESANRSSGAARSK